jgi:hypothetical protein
MEFYYGTKINNKTNKIITISPYRPTPHNNNVASIAHRTMHLNGLITAKTGKFRNFLNPLLKEFPQLFLKLLKGFLYPLLIAISPISFSLLYTNILFHKYYKLV